MTTTNTRCWKYEKPEQSMALSDALTWAFGTGAAIGLLQGPRGARWLRFDGGKLTSANASEAADSSDFDARFFNGATDMPTELRWRCQPELKNAVGLAVKLTPTTDSTSGAEHIAAEAELPVQFLLQGSHSISVQQAEGFAALSGGSKPVLYVPFPAPVSGKGLAIDALELVAQGIDGNAEVVDTVWLALSIQKPAERLRKGK